MYKRFKKWIKNLKYIAPKARRNVIRYNLLACILSVLYFIPFLIGTILYFIFALALCVIVPYLTWDKELIFGNSLIQSLLNSLNHKAFFNEIFEDYILSFRCKKCGESQMYVANVNQVEVEFKKFSTFIWQWFDNKERICTYCQANDMIAK